jgi:hypothetical protein
VSEHEARIGDPEELFVSLPYEEDAVALARSDHAEDVTIFVDAKSSSVEPI